MFCLLLIMFSLSLTLTWGLRRYALDKNIMDIPNHRSSHSVPTPRGGGIAFIIAFLIALPFVRYWNYHVTAVQYALICSGLLVAILGFLDDHGHIAAKTRLIGHFTASMFALYCLGGMPPVFFGDWLFSAGFFLNVLAILYLVWILNLYNFMDGIDGIAAIEAISVCLGSVVLYWLNGHIDLMGLPLALAATVAGFLFWNFPPARIFMGDAGSGFLGLILGILSLQAAGVDSDYFWCWLILLGVFIVDATITLLNRLFRGCKVYEAHRSHAYQHAAVYLGRHRGVTLSVLMINLFWLLPNAILVKYGLIKGFTDLWVAYAPLILMAIFFKAGREINQTGLMQNAEVEAKNDFNERV